MKKLLLITTLGLSTLAMANDFENKNMETSNVSAKKSIQEIEKDHVNIPTTISFKDQ